MCSARLNNILRTGNLLSLPQPPKVVVVEVPDVFHLEPEHEQALEAAAPGEHRLLHAQRPRHLGTEDPRAAHLQPLPHLVVEDHHLHRGLRVGEVRRPELDPAHPELPVELCEHAHQVAEVEAVAYHYALHLVELGEVLVIEALVAVDLSDAEDPRLRATRVPGRLYRDRGVVRPQHEPAGFIHIPLVAPPLAPRLPSPFVRAATFATTPDLEIF